MYGIEVGICLIYWQEIKSGIILHIKEEKLYSRCTQKPYADLLSNRLTDFK